MIYPCKPRPVELTTELGFAIAREIPKNLRYRNLQTVSGYNCGFSTTTGSGIPAGSCIVNPSRYLVSKTGHYVAAPMEYSGQLMTKDIAEVFALSIGWVKPYSRNSIAFVQSRAARKRGYVTKDSRYVRYAEYHKKQRETAGQSAGE